MRSSTSSSELLAELERVADFVAPAAPRRGLLRDLARYVAPTLGVAALLVAAADVWYRQAPAVDDGSIETAILDGQLTRARQAPPADLLVLGDSSALMGIDATRLGVRLGRSVESLATLAWVGPVGYARLLDLYAASGRRPGRVLLMVNPALLALSDGDFDRATFEARLTDGRWFRQPPPVAGARRKSYAVLSPWISPPLPGVYGPRYGFPEQLTAFLEHEHGSLVDPNRGISADKAECGFLLTPAVVQRLGVLRQTLARLGVERVDVGITPVSQTCYDDKAAAARAVALAGVAAALGLPADHVVASPPALPLDRFATVTHLNEVGRGGYTEALAAALAPR